MGALPSCSSLTPIGSLSAQTTDRKVNEVTPALWAAAGAGSDGATPEQLAAMPVDSIQCLIRTVGLAPSKARYLSQLSSQLVERHGSQVPRTLAELENLSGVGHKTASVVLSQAFGVPAMPVDTHIWRLAMRWGLAPADASVVVVERALTALFPEREWSELHVRLILFGREHCPAKAHNSASCPVCSWAAEDGAVPVLTTPAKTAAKPKLPAKKRARVTASLPLTSD